MKSLPVPSGWMLPLVGLAMAASVRAQALLYGIGDLPGGAVNSRVGDATVVGGVIYAVGSSSANSTIGVSDTAVMWTSTGGLVAIPNLVANPGATSQVQGFAITPDGAYIAARLRAGAGGSQVHAARVTTAGLSALDLGTLSGFPQQSAAMAISNDGSVQYGFAVYEGAGKLRAVRYTAAGPTVTAIPFVNGTDDASVPPQRGTSADGSVMVGTSRNTAADAADGWIGFGAGNRAFRYVHGAGVTPIPLLTGGTWNTAMGISAAGNLALVAGDSPSAPQGELYFHDSTSGVLTSLGSPNGSRRPLNAVGMSADGAVVVVMFQEVGGTATTGYLRNAQGWHNFTAAALRAGVNLSGWTLDTITGVSRDGSLVFGAGTHNGSNEGWVLQFPAGYLASFTEPAVVSTPAGDIVGAWALGDGSASDSTVAVFFANGYYMLIAGGGAGAAPNGVSGFERGQYAWNGSSGALLLSSLLDTNGDIGLSDVDGSTGVKFTVAGDTGTLIIPGEGPYVLSRVKGLSPIVGAFGGAAQADNAAVAVFLPSGYYFYAQDGDSSPGGDPSGFDGMERGTYTWNAATGAFTTTTLQDTNGQWGFSHPRAARTIRFSNNLATLTLTSGSDVSSAPRVTASTGTGSPVPGVRIPRLIPAGATLRDARALAAARKGGVIVGVSGSYAVRPSGGPGAQALVAPNYTNPQPYNLSYVVRLLANGEPDPAFTSAPGGDGTVNTVVVQPDDKILVGGTFASFNGVFFRNLARLQADGKADATFAVGSGPDAQVNAIAVQPDGKILVGGAFQIFGGAARPYLVRLSATGAIDAAFSPAPNGTVNSIILQPDGKILIAGNFTRVGGVTRNRVARLLATGAIDPAFDPGAGADNEVVALVLQPDGAVVAGGDFTAFAGQPRGRIVRLLASGALDPAFLAAATANNTVISLGLEIGRTIVLGGAFTQVNGVERNRLARLLADGSLDPGFDPGDGANAEVRAVLPRSDGTVFLGGAFDQYQGAAVNEVVAVTSVPVVTAFVQPPRPITVALGGTARFFADATGTALSYQWLKNGVAIAGATGSSLTLSPVGNADQGRYTLQVLSATTTGTALSADASLTVSAGAPGQIINLSVLTSLDAPDASFTLGFVVGGTGTSGAKPLLIRAAGPALAAFGVGNPLPDPKLQFFAGGSPAGENDNWNGSTTISGLIAQVGAFPYTSATSKDAAFAPANLTTAANSVVVSGVSGAMGAVIAEVYDATPAGSVTAATPRLVNVSVLKHIPAGALLTAGFVVNGSTSKTVLVRVIGPTLATFGVGGPMADPQLALFNGSTQIATNDNWGGNAALKTAMGDVGAFSIEPTSRDAALVITLEPGSYSVQASGVDGTAGAALVEVYEVP